MYDQLTKLEHQLTKLEQKKSRGGTICPQCGIQNTRNARFCSGCGSQLLHMCSTCKKLNTIGSSFCSNCGFPLVISQTIEIKAPSSDNINIEVVEANFRECILKEFNIKINYPSIWIRKTDDSDPKVKVIFEAPKENTDQLPDGVSVYVDDTIGEMTLVTAIKNLIKSLKEQCSDFELIESTPSTLSGIPAHQIIFSSSQKMMKSLIILTIKDKVAYWVTYIADPKRYLKFLSSTEQMISSFVFLD